MFPRPVHPQQPIYLKHRSGRSTPWGRTFKGSWKQWWSPPPLPCYARLCPACPFPLTYQTSRLHALRMNLQLQQRQTLCCPSTHHAIPQIHVFTDALPSAWNIFPSSLFLSLPNSCLSFETPPGVFLWCSACPTTAGLYPHFCCQYNTLCLSLIFLGQEEGSFLLHDSPSTCPLTGGGRMDRVGFGKELSMLSSAPPSFCLGASSPWGSYLTFCRHRLLQGVCGCSALLGTLTE